jgi:Zn-dependent protease
MWVSLAGPAANLLMALATGILLRFRIFPWVSSNATLYPSPAEFLFTFLSINLLLMLFNLIPIAPLDGEKVLTYLLPARLSAGYARIQPFGPLILMALLFVLPLLGVDVINWIISPALTGLQKLILGVA